MVTNPMAGKKKNGKQGPDEEYGIDHHIKRVNGTESRALRCKYQQKGNNKCSMIGMTRKR